MELLEELLQGGRRGQPSPPVQPEFRPTRLLQEVDVDELEGSHLVTEDARPNTHGGLADDVDHVTYLDDGRQQRWQAVEGGGQG